MSRTSRTIVRPAVVLPAVALLLACGCSRRPTYDQPAGTTLSEMAPNQGLREPKAYAADFEPQPVALLLAATAVGLLALLPGLALFHAGQVHKQNVLSVFMYALFLAGAMTLAWTSWAYSLAFAPTEWFVELPGARAQGDWPDTGRFRVLGGTEHCMMAGIEPQAGGYEAFYPLDDATDQVPHLLLMTWRLVFFLFAVVLVATAFAGRAKFEAVIAFAAVWGTLAFAPLAHWIWGGGWLEQAGFLDAAGGALVHTSAGFSAFVMALLLGRRSGPQQRIAPHNLAYTAAGAMLLWVGWTALASGAAGGEAVRAAETFAAVHLATAGGLLGWALLEWVWRERVTLLGACSGALAGLAAGAAGCAYVAPESALLIGAAGGATCCAACVPLRRWRRYDGALDIFAVHGIGGLVGVVLTGVFAVETAQGGAPHQLSRLARLAVQGLGALSAIVVAVAVSAALMLALRLTIGLRRRPEAEAEGADLADQAEVAYRLSAQ